MKLNGVEQSLVLTKVVCSNIDVNLFERELTQNLDYYQLGE